MRSASASVLSCKAHDLMPADGRNGGLSLINQVARLRSGQGVFVGIWECFLAGKKSSSVELYFFRQFFFQELMRVLVDKGVPSVFFRSAQKQTGLARLILAVKWIRLDDLAAHQHQNATDMNIRASVYKAFTNCVSGDTTIASALNFLCSAVFINSVSYYFSRHFLAPFSK